MLQKSSVQLRADDTIILNTKEGLLHFTVVKVTNIHGTPQPGKKARVTDVQIKVRPVPGECEPVLLIPASKLWTVK